MEALAQHRGASILREGWQLLAELTSAPAWLAVGTLIDPSAAGLTVVEPQDLEQLEKPWPGPVRVLDGPLICLTSRHD